MAVRKAVLADYAQVYSMALRGLKPESQHLVFSQEKLRREILLIAEPQHYGLVAEEGGVIVGYLGAVVHEMLYFERNQATIVAFYSEKPGAGAALMREFMRLTKDDLRVKRVMVFLSEDADPRAEKMLLRINKNFKKVPAFSCVV